MLAVAAVAADGPVQQVVGVNRTDSDDGSGEQWGRQNGRTFTFTVTDASAFTTLSWGSAGTPPSAALDDAVDEPGEVMTFDGTSDLPGGVARWIGQANLPLLNGGVLAGIPTRFTLTVRTIGGQPLPLTNIPAGPQPGVDVKASGSFTANLLFEMQRVAGMPGPLGQWEPLLTLYDSLQITLPGLPPGEGGPVLTSFASGFYFTGGAPAGLTLEEHDTGVTQRLNTLIGQAGAIKDDTGFLRGENSRLIGLGTKLNDVEQLIRNLPVGQIPQDIARQAHVQSAKEDLMQTLLILFGAIPCPEPAMCDAVTQINELATQASLDQLREQVSNLQASIGELQDAVRGAARLEAEVVELTEPATPKRRRWLVRTTRAGAPVAASLAALHAITTPKHGFAESSDVTAMATVRQLLPGLMEVVLEVGSPSLADVAFRFSVQHAAGGTVLEAQAVVGDVRR